MNIKMKNKRKPFKFKKALYSLVETLMIAAVIIIIVKFTMMYTGMMVSFGN